MDVKEVDCGCGLDLTDSWQGQEVTATHEGHCPMDKLWVLCTRWMKWTHNENSMLSLSLMHAPMFNFCNCFVDFEKTWHGRSALEVSGEFHFCSYRSSFSSVGRPIVTRLRVKRFDSRRSKIFFSYAQQPGWLWDPSSWWLLGAVSQVVKWPRRWCDRWLAEVQNSWSACVRSRVCLHGVVPNEVQW
jgi:hypothetical protein